MTHRLTQTSACLAILVATAAVPARGGDAQAPDRSPIALAIARDGSRMLVANQTANSVSWLDLIGGKVIVEVPTGDMPAGVAISGDGTRGIVTHWRGYDAAVLRLTPEGVKVEGRVEVGPEPRGVAIGPDGRTAFVAVGAANEVARVDLVDRKVTGRVAVGREPRALAITPDGSLLVVANTRGRSVSVIGLASFQVERTLDLGGDNLRQVAITPDGKTAYVAGMKNRRFPTTENNIDLGWVLGQRVFRVALDGSARPDGLSIDPKGDAAGDAHGVALVGPEANTLAVSCGGTHEAMLIRLDGRPLSWRGGLGRDLMAEDLVGDPSRFRRVELGGRPTDLVAAPDGRTFYAANYLSNAIQQVDAATGRATRTIALGGPATPSLARRGEALFHDADRSANHWYSCNTCHSDGHTNGLDFDTFNDGWIDGQTAHARSRKKVPTLRRVDKTAPWTWHGWQESLSQAVAESFTKSMQGPKPAPDEVEAVVAYLATLDFPPNPHRTPDGGLTEEARRGEALFRSAKAACSSCHKGPEFTDGRKHDVGLGERGDVYEGHNPPSLIGVYDKDPYLHDGRAPTLRAMLTGDHSPEAVGGSALTEAELGDLIAYLQSL
ncbi:cytochrome c peroxidase [Tundrisphaera sp. TA3]|uniref:cytochrome c peroxidase n=1 Tax=Tundrisphaera sp. TA3 TaxID=3435775 RepID=UPI003EB92D31